jgi:glucose-6-phosphate 1-dehydrogenase
VANYQAQTIAYPAPTARPYRKGAEVLPPHVVVLFGATGDLARRKLLPGMAHLDASALAPQVIVVASSLEEMSDDDFRAFAHSAVAEYGKHRLTTEQWDTFAATLRYVPSSAGPEALAAAVAAAEEQLGEGVRRLHYLSVPPKAALDVIGMLDQAKLVERARVVMEKPFGTDLESAMSLNEQVHEVFDESQIFRIDHFLGKEAAQNVLALRFANGLFEPIWNRNFIDHIQIDVPETLGLDRRADFYESTGAYKDMIVTHLFQVLAFVAMEPPTALDPRSISEEKNKVFRAMLPVLPSHVVRGQFSGYRELEGVARDSDTETFIALHCQLDNWRWAGVPFYLRTGKRMAEGQRIISIAFKEAPRTMFPPDSGVGSAGPDHLTFDLADESKVSLSYYGKRPGPGMKLDKLSMQFSTQETDRAGDVLEAYERLILDAMRGDHTLFTTADGIESLWERSIPLLDNPPPVKPYAPGSWGPNAIHQLITPHAWRLPFERSWREKKS